MKFTAGGQFTREISKFDIITSENKKIILHYNNIRKILNTYGLILINV